MDLQIWPSHTNFLGKFPIILFSKMILNDPTLENNTTKAT